MRILTASLVILLGLLVWAPSAAANSAWLQEKGHLEVSAGVIYESFDEFFRGTDRMEFPKGKFQQVTGDISLEYGLLDNISVDLALGYVRAFGKALKPGQVAIETNDGLTDVTLGMKFRILDEFEWDSPFVPTLSFRFGGIIAGTYETDDVFPGIPGDGASGFEAEFAAAKVGLPLDIALFGNLGIRARNKNVPLEWHLRASALRTFGDLVTLSVAYDQWTATSGLDLGVPPFSPDRFRELKEISRNIEAGIGLSAMGRYFGFYYTRTLSGRNTGIRDSYGFMLSTPITLLDGS